jgi:hypothetical protein
VTIHVTGGCRDIAIASRLAPDLLARKCARVYVNAGTGSPDPAKAQQLEYNVKLDPAAYAAVFRLPCPVYWMPCFEEMETPPGAGRRPVMEFGTYYRFRQSDILPHLPEMAQRFFTFMHRGRHPREGRAGPPSDWLQYLLGPKDDAELDRQSQLYRNMWCTAGFLHAVGSTVTGDGGIVPLEDAGDSSVFAFEPISVACDAGGVTRWRFSEAASNRFLFRVRDTRRYEAAMTAALKSLLSRLC